MAARAAPLRLLVTLNPKKLKNAILTMLPTVDAYAQDTGVSLRLHTWSAHDAVGRMLSVERSAGDCV